MQNLTIGALATAAGVGVETVRFYQRKALVGEPARAGGIRRYDDRDVDRIRFIKQAQTAGFTLAEIGELIALDSGEDRTRVQQMAAARIEALDAKIEQLKAARTSLVKLAGQCAATSTGPCPIIESFR